MISLKTHRREDDECNRDLTPTADFGCFLGQNRNYNPLRETFVYVVVALASEALWFRCGSSISFVAILSASSVSGCPSSAPLGQFIRRADGPHRVWPL